MRLIRFPELSKPLFVAVSKPISASVCVCVCVCVCALSLKCVCMHVCYYRRLPSNRPYQITAHPLFWPKSLAEGSLHLYSHSIVRKGPTSAPGRNSHGYFLVAFWMNVKVSHDFL